MGFLSLCRKGAGEILRRKASGGGGRMMSTATNPTPWLMLPPTFDRSRGGMVYNFYSLADDEVLLFNKYGGGRDPVDSPDDDARVVGSSHGWLALMNRRNNDLFLSNPLSRRHIKLPPLENLPDPVFNLCGGGSVSKLILSGSPDDGECRAMMSFGPGDRLAFCLPGRSREWTPIGELFVERLESANNKCARVYEDFLYSSRTNLFNCLTSFGSDTFYYYSYADNKDHHKLGSEFLTLEDWDLRNSESPRIDWIQTETTVQGKPVNDEGQTLPDFDCGWLDGVDLGQCSIMKHLVYVEERNELLLLYRVIMDRATVGFVAAKVIKENGGRVRLVGSSLEGLAVFVGMNHSFAAETAERGYLKPNSVYFTEHKIYVGRDDEEEVGGDIGIFNCADATFSSCYYPRNPNPTSTSTSTSTSEINMHMNVIDPPPLWFNATLP